MDDGFHIYLYEKLLMWEACSKSILAWLQHK